jgi:predicted double-glycine peptidase
MKALKFPELRQTYNFDCGAMAALAVILYYGFDCREDMVMNIAKTTKRGTSIKGIVRVMEKFGLKYKAKRMTIGEIKRYIDKKIPVILALQAWTEQKRVDWEDDWFDGHYVVAIGYDRRRLFFEDPSSILRTYLSIKEMEKRWHDEDVDGKKYIHFGIAVFGKEGKQRRKRLVHMG